MKRDYIWFNSIGFFLCVCFALATMWQWRFLYFDLKAPAAPVEENHEVISYANFVQNVSSSMQKEILIKEPVATSTVAVTSTVIASDKKQTSTSTENDSEQKSKQSSSNLTTAYNELQGMHEGVILNLDIPYTSQAPERKWIDPWEDACEEASILMLDAYYKGYGLSPLFAKDEIQKMIAWEGERAWYKSISIQKVVQLYEHFFPKGKHPRIVEHPTVKQIKEFIKNGTPVLVVADGKTLPNKWYSNGGPEYHALIIRGFTEDAFITNDPGVNRGKNFAFPIDALMNSIHDWNNGDVRNGTPAIMVLE